jgi:hypothetical protein
MALTLDGTNGIVSSGSITTQSATGVIFSDSSSLPAASSPYVLKNRIINGAMVIDQRNAGASVTPTTNATYTLDRYTAILTQASKYSVQQNAAAVTPPTGFTNYLGVTSLSSYAVLAADLFLIQQRIEGYNIADLAWGTANAKTVTLSFWVRSSLTGTFGGSLNNSAFNRSYPFTYTISVANTWEQKTITIAGDTSGTWLTTNGTGINVNFGLGVGSTYSGTADAWAAGEKDSVTGAVSVVGTNGATWYITGVQLEQNTSATPFERRLYNQELANCQRYYFALPINTPIGTGFSYSPDNYINFSVPVTMRATPTVTCTNIKITDSATYTLSSSSVTITSGLTGQNSYVLDFNIAGGTNFRAAFSYTGGTAGNGLFLTAEL